MFSVTSGLRCVVDVAIVAQGAMPRLVVRGVVVPATPPTPPMPIVDVVVTPANPPGVMCHRCGSGHHLIATCPQKDGVCYNCMEPGHVSSNCRFKAVCHMFRNGEHCKYAHTMTKELKVRIL